MRCAGVEVAPSGIFSFSQRLVQYQSAFENEIQKKKENISLKNDHIV
jgi:hypothetical protein